MKYIILVLLLSFQIFSNQIDEVVYIDNLRVVFNPKENTPSYIPKDFIPEKSSLLKYFELDISNIEAGLFFETKVPFEDLSKIYEESFKKNDWRIFRKEEKENNLVFQVENISKRVISIIIKKETNSTKIKIFYKRQR